MNSHQDRIRFACYAVQTARHIRQLSRQLVPGSDACDQAQEQLVAAEAYLRGVLQEAGTARAKLPNYEDGILALLDALEDARPESDK